MLIKCKDYFIVSGKTSFTCYAMSLSNTKIDLNVLKYSAPKLFFRKGIKIDAEANLATNK